MSEATTAEQFILPGMPADSKVARAVRETLDETARWKADSESEGGLMTRSMAAAVLGISRPRVFQLCQAGLLGEFRHFDKVWLSTREVMAFMHQERKTGRPPKLPKTMDIWKAFKDGITGADDEK